MSDRVDYASLYSPDTLVEVWGGRWDGTLGTVLYTTYDARIDEHIVAIRISNNKLIYDIPMNLRLL